MEWTRSSISAGAPSVTALASSKNPRATWLPAALSAALLLAIAATFLWLSNRIDAQRYKHDEVLDPAYQRLTRVHRAFLEELAAWHAYRLGPTEAGLAEIKAVHERRRRQVDELSAGAAHVGLAFDQGIARLRELLRRWEAAPVAVMSGDLSLAASNRLLAQRAALSNGVLTHASRLGDAVSLEMRQLEARTRRLERRRLLILAGLFPLALLGIVLTAWFAKRATWSHQRALDNAAQEALLRDAVAALTGDQVLPAALNRIATNAMRMAGADGAFIEYCAEARSQVEIVAAVGTHVPPSGIRAGFAGSSTDEIVRAGTPELIADLSAHDSEIGRLVGDQWQRCFAIAVPLQSAGDVNGALVLTQHDRPVQIRAETVSRLAILGAWAALALRRQQLATRLEIERARLQAVVEEMPVGVMLADAPSGRIVLFNRHAVDLWGSPAPVPHTIEEYAHWQLNRLDGTPYQVHERPLARSILRGEIIKGEEAELERADGTRRIVQMNSAPIRDPRGEIVAGVAAAVDISEEKSREQRARFLDEISRQLASTLDYEATLEAILHLMVPRLGDLASIHHRHDGTIIRRVDAETDPRIHELLQNIEREYPMPLPSAHPIAVAIRTGKAQLREVVEDELLQAISRDERQLNWLRSLGIKSAMAVPLIVRGKTTGALQLISVNPAHHYNCDDLALAEEIARRAALAIDNAHLFQKVTDASQASGFLSDTAMTLSGSLEYEEVLRLITRLAVPFVADFALAYAKNELGLAQHVASAHADPSRESLLEEMARLYRPDPRNLGSTVIRALGTGQPVLIERVNAELLDSMGFEPRVRELLDALAPVSWMTIPLVARNRILGTLVFASVQPDRHYSAEDLVLGQLFASRAALAIQNAMFYENAREALTTRDEVLAIVSHDLRNPLHTIGMSTQLLIEDPLDEKQRRHHLEIIARAKERMDRLIQDLLDVARVEGGKALTIELRRECPATFIRETCELFDAPVREKNVRFAWSLPEDLPDVMVDCGRIHQVLDNLIGNALKFTPEGGRIEVRAGEDQGMVQVCVSDTGPGIPLEDLNRIFHSFWQAPRASRLGAGLGLSISRGIIEQHGGRLWVESLEGVGATFFFTLPIADARDELRAAD